MPDWFAASFVVRLIYQTGNEQLPWNITVQHVQTGQVYRVTDPVEVGVLFKDLMKSEFGNKGQVINLDLERM